MRLMHEYSGLCASSYDLLLPEKEIEDAGFFRNAIEENGQPALEIGCGTGRLILKFLEDGLDVEGVDSSGEMLAILQRKAKQRGLKACTHEQLMQSLDLSRRYRTIFVPVASFMLVPQLDQAARALSGFHHHLEPGGKVMIPLLLPWKEDIATNAAPAGKWRLRRESNQQEDNRTVRCWELATYDFQQQLKLSQLRFEVISDGQIRATEKRQFSLRWYTQEQFASMLRQAGFRDIHAVRDYSLQPAQPDDASFSFIAAKP